MDPNEIIGGRIETLWLRNGIIPCGRCAFFVSNGPPAPGIPFATEGTCRARIPQRSMVSSPVWPTVDGDPAHGHGCGEGLLREEAAPLPPEQSKENQ